jgi:hypothetical protein
MVIKTSTNQECLMEDYHQKGGINRMKQLTIEERSDLGKRAYLEKICPSIPRATHTGTLRIGDQEIECAVLSDGRRVLSARSIWKIMGRCKPSGNDLRKARGDQVPVFLTANNLKPFIPKDVRGAIDPIIYKYKGCPRITGYECSMLPLACDSYLGARKAGVLTHDQKDLADQCEIIMRGLAKTGLVALIDECTGYQEVRDRRALQAILDDYLLKEFAEWSKRFPTSFYEQIFRLNNWKFQEISAKKPMIIGKYTNDVVYSRLLPGLVEELQNRNPKNELGYRPVKNHQYLSEIGNVDLERHISATIALMKCCADWKEFKGLIDKVYPVRSSKDIFKKGVQNVT